MRIHAAAILAGGEGRRLGGVAKEGLPSGGGPLGPELALRLGSSFDTIIVVTKNPALYGQLPVSTTADLLPGYGPLSGLHAALSKAVELSLSPRRGTGSGIAGASGAGEEGWLWLAACDMPAFDPRLVELLASRLEAALGASPATAAPFACLARRGGHFEPFQALYSLNLLPHLRRLLEVTALRRLGVEGGREARDPSFKELFAELPVLFVEEEEVKRITPDWGLYFNINHPEDLERWQGHRR